MGRVASGRRVRAAGRPTTSGFTRHGGSRTGGGEQAGGVGLVGGGWTTNSGGRHAGGRSDHQERRLPLASGEVGRYYGEVPSITSFPN